jgi:NADH:ubiquinone oxidoreductase subunit
MNMSDQVFSWFNGRQVGTDAAGNRYFIEREPRGGGARPRRRVLYAGAAVESPLPAAWAAWLQYGRTQVGPQEP